jgi:phosphoribosylanthranilate isomerase
METKVKICGLTRPADAALAVSLGAWALGVIFAEGSPRRLDLEEAAAVLSTAPAGIEKVGVFVNAGMEDIAAAVDACRLTAVQLHGDEDAEACVAVGSRTGCTVIKAIRVAGPESLEGVVRIDTGYLLLDTYHPGRHGGTGEVFDWGLAASLPDRIKSYRLILSGGLTPENVAEAIQLVRPFAIDVASGIESEPGIKDQERMKLLFEKVKGVE